MNSEPERNLNHAGHAKKIDRLSRISERERLHTAARRHRGRSAGRGGESRSHKTWAHGQSRAARTDSRVAEECRVNHGDTEAQRLILKDTGSLIREVFSASPRG